MRHALKAFVALLLIALGVLAAHEYFNRHPVAVLDPKGTIGAQQSHLILLALGLMLIVVIPVFMMTALIVWRYRITNTRAKPKYDPDWNHDVRLEALWWGIPIAIITVLGVVAWQSSHQLDPYRPIASKNPALTVQVVALDWKWLFIYPEQHVASVNLLELPVNTPVNFQVTADAPMNSFWIPSLGGQIYAMPGMATQLHLMATSTGDFHGSSANISGDGFASMAFTARAVSAGDFDNWVFDTRLGQKTLDQTAYNRLSQPGTLDKPAYYADVTPNLFTTIVYKYMDPSLQKQTYGSYAPESGV